MNPGFLYRCHTSEYSHAPAWDFLGLPTDYLQLHSEWVPTQSVCGVSNTESSNKNVTATLASDVVLLVTMIAGLLRMRRHDIMSGFGKLLWRQVGDATPHPL